MEASRSLRWMRQYTTALGRALWMLVAWSAVPAVSGAPVHLVMQEPVRISPVAPGVVLLDFERVAFGNLRLRPPAGAPQTIVLHFGEALVDGRIDRSPPGSVRYGTTSVRLQPGQEVVAAPPADRRNTEADSPKHPPAILTPPEWGVVLPFRWVEVEGWSGDVGAGQMVRQAAFARDWDDGAAAFHSADALLNRIWELCRYTIKATTFAGIYVDGDRERIPYEADAHLNQLSHYATDHDVGMARDTFDWLMKHPTWPSEWAAYMIFMAHADWMQTGEVAWLAARYDALRGKLLLSRARADGLLVSSAAQTRRNDLVDWPAGERDGYVFKPVNTVVNAFHLRALALMAELAAALGKDAEAAEFSARERTTRAAFQKVLFDPTRGVFRDGEGTDHASQHATLFPLAFGLVPDAQRTRAVARMAERGMACSVYAAQYLLEGLFLNDADTRALALMTADNDRSWKHMVESGTTLTWEAWDQKYKPNQDWNHAWGAAPANLLPRFVLGAQPLSPGWGRARIRPHPGGLEFARGTIPTPRGPVSVRWENGAAFKLSLTLPKGMSAAVELPASAASRGVVLHGPSGRKLVGAQRRDARWVLAEDVTGAVTLEVLAGESLP